MLQSADPGINEYLPVGQTVHILLVCCSPLTQARKLTFNVWIVSLSPSPKAVDIWVRSIFDEEIVKFMFGAPGDEINVTSENVATPFTTVTSVFPITLSVDDTGEIVITESESVAIVRPSASTSLYFIGVAIVCPET